jgi:hypothetical protein
VDRVPLPRGKSIGVLTAGCYPGTADNHPTQSAGGAVGDALMGGHSSIAAAPSDPLRSKGCFDDYPPEKQSDAVKSEGAVWPVGSVGPLDHSMPPSVYVRSLEFNGNQLDLSTGQGSELPFADPSISDLGAVLQHVRPEIETIVLDRATPPARQMAIALEGREGLDAAHVIAHVAPGRVNFEAVEWSVETLEGEADDLANIGRVLGSTGDLLLWSCEAGAGAAGQASSMRCRAQLERKLRRPAISSGRGRSADDGN